MDPMPPVAPNELEVIAVARIDLPPPILPVHPTALNQLRSSLVARFYDSAMPVKYNPGEAASIPPSCHLFWDRIVFESTTVFTEIENFYCSVNASYRLCPLIGVREGRCGQCVVDSRITGQIKPNCTHLDTTPVPPVLTRYKCTRQELRYMLGLQHVLEAFVQVFATFLNRYQEATYVIRRVIRCFAFDLLSLIVVPPCHSFLYVVSMDLHYIATLVSQGPSFVFSRPYLVNLCQAYRLPNYLPFLANYTPDLS